MVVAVGAVLVFRGICGVFSGGGLFRVPDEQSVEHDHQFHESGIFRNVMGEALRRGDFVDIIEIASVVPYLMTAYGKKGHCGG